MHLPTPCRSELARDEASTSDIVMSSGKSLSRASALLQVLRPPDYSGAAALKNRLCHPCHA